MYKVILSKEHDHRVVQHFCATLKQAEEWANYYVGLDSQEVATIYKEEYTLVRTICASLT